MGARPAASLLSLSLPRDATGVWAEEFMRGYHDISKRCGVALVGGDTTSSEGGIAINVVALGRCPAGSVKRRSDAVPGDAICVTGRLGASAAGLRDILTGMADTDYARCHRLGRARVDEGAWLGGRAEVHAMMDISDGIASDLRHIMECSGVGAEVHTECIPTDVDVETAVCGGEDYELLLTVDAGCCDKLREDYNARFGDELHVIGRIVGSADGRIVWLDNGRRIAPDWRGFEHY